MLFSIYQLIYQIAILLKLYGKNIYVGIREYNSINARKSSIIKE